MSYLARVINSLCISSTLSALLCIPLALKSFMIHVSFFCSYSSRCSLFVIFKPSCSLCYNINSMYQVYEYTYYRCYDC
ncbi:hypothetical protein BCN_C1_51 (plasmid) [Bacillus cereus NC7401]|nr:hypothetical protein BCN_C1_51 [Bacillus cereus NC7401]